VSQLVDLVVVGTVQHAWRNSPVEDTHASAWCPLTDGEMMRTNAATTRLVRELVAELFLGGVRDEVPTMAVGASVGSDDDPDGGADGVVVVDDCSVLDDVDLLVEGLLDPLQLAVTRRVLLCGYTVTEATGEFYDDLAELVMIDWWSPRRHGPYQRRSRSPAKC
jgi:hypothetical protein